MLGSCAGYQELLEDATGTVPNNGWFEGSGETQGVWRMHVTQCQSGERESFYGVTFGSDDDTRAVRIVRNPVGPMTVAVSSSQGEFSAIACTEVRGSIRPTGVRINGVRVVTGEIQVLCNGLKGAARFTCS